MSWVSVIRAASLVAYPVIVYLALGYVDAKYLGVLLLLILILRNRDKARSLARDVDRGAWTLLAMMGLFAAAVWWSNDEFLLRLYPALLNAVGLISFGYTLYRPPSMIERFARLRDPALPAAAIRYTRGVTWVWCVFFLVNGSIAAYTAVFASREAWVLYNGLIAYALMATLFAGEWLVRRRVLQERTAA